ncbi:uncharacterized protein LOC110981060 [Acanthaster planci]|uniref:Uncharacterized protein LOC110981060 n=1 Tax=Acanthaster planci TaxID=133434 RepID=A0A8B7YL02_ACAPL|nr:uncharacterized protein LOC110981060 [Acanthaster planci]
MSEDFTSTGLKDVIMSLQEECQKLSEVKEEPEGEQIEDYFGKCAGDADDDGEDGFDDDDLDYEPGRESRRTTRSVRAMPGRKGKKQRRSWNLTYSHEQRVRMGYYGAKWGVKAMKKRYPGVKDSTARDMCNYVLALVRDGILTLDLPLEKQVIPPKMRNGFPVQSVIQIKESSSFEPNSEPGSNQEPAQKGGTDITPPTSKNWLAGIGGKNQPFGNMSMETTDKALQPPSTNHGDGSPSSTLSFEDRVKIGFMAALEGSTIAVKKCEESDSKVRECRNLVIRLIQSGKLSLDVPLEQQEIPTEDPEEPVPPEPVRRGRPPKHSFGRFTLPPEAKTFLISSRTTMQNNPPPLQPTPTESENHSQRNVQMNPSEVSPSPWNDHVQLQRGSKDIFLGSDLAFRRWRNRRTSLKFQSDEAFAMHLMDVHDAFCSEQCSGGGRHEHQQGTQVS